VIGICTWAMASAIRATGRTYAFDKNDPDGGPRPVLRETVDRYMATPASRHYYRLIDQLTAKGWRMNGELQR
jgi:hypothetical protein